jgi:hypothetical protein
MRLELVGVDLDLGLVTAGIRLKGHARERIAYSLPFKSFKVCLGGLLMTPLEFLFGGKIRFVHRQSRVKQAYPLIHAL